MIYMYLYVLPNVLSSVSESSADILNDWLCSADGLSLVFVFLVSVPRLYSEVHLMFGEKVACAAVSPHPYLLPYVQVQCFPPLRQLLSDF